MTDNKDSVLMLYFEQERAQVDPAFERARRLQRNERRAWWSIDLDVLGMNTPALPGGQMYRRQPDGHIMLCNADGTRSIFDDVDE